MKNITKMLALSALVIGTLTCFKTKVEPVHEPDDAKPLYDTIAAMDAKWQDAYNHCKLDVMRSSVRILNFITTREA